MACPRMRARLSHSPDAPQLDIPPDIIPTPLSNRSTHCVGTYARLTYPPKQNLTLIGPMWAVRGRMDQRLSGTSQGAHFRCPSELMRCMPPPVGIGHHRLCGYPLFGKHYLRFLGGVLDRTCVRPLSVAFDNATVRCAVRKAGFRTV